MAECTTAFKDYHRNKNVRMLPVTTRCNSCGTYNYRGTKLKFKKEDAVGEKFMGFQIFKLYSKCPKCSAEFVLKTNPQNSDYIVEAGATLIIEPFRDQNGRSKLSLVVGKQSHKEPSDGEASTSQPPAADYFCKASQFKNLSLAENSDGEASASQPSAADYSWKELSSRISER